MKSEGGPGPSTTRNPLGNCPRAPLSASSPGTRCPRGALRMAPEGPSPSTRPTSRCSDTGAHRSCAVRRSCGSPPAFLPKWGKATGEKVPASFLLPAGFHSEGFSPCRALVCTSGIFHVNVSAAPRLSAQPGLPRLRGAGAEALGRGSLRPLPPGGWTAETDTRS